LTASFRLNIAPASSAFETLTGLMVSACKPVDAIALLNANAAKNALFTMFSCD
jgi:hypothetical protein